MNIEISDCRKKSRHIFETRYTPLHRVFDSKGHYIEAVEGMFKAKLSHWRLQPGIVQFGDDFENLGKQINLDHLKTSIIYEDPATHQEFIDDTKKYSKIFFETFPEAFSKIKRLGYRRISIITLPKVSSYEEFLQKVVAAFYSNNSKLTFKFTDCRFTFSHELGQVTIGPIKEGETWLKEAFSQPTVKVPKCGIAIDIDSAAINPKITNIESYFSAMGATFSLTDKVEEEVFLALTGA